MQSQWLRSVQDGWLGRTGWSASLLPIAWMYGALVQSRAWCYRMGIFARYRAPVPVVVVGNVLAGGAGKTPTVIALVQHLNAQGWQVGIVSRGYGRASDQCSEVLPDSLPHWMGDEPILMRQRTQAPVFVARRRADAVKALLQTYPRTDIVVCDDGLQHLALERDIEVIVFDDRGVGNGWLLPAGPLREPWPRRPAGLASLVLHTGPQAAFGGFTARRSLGAHAYAMDGTKIPLANLADAPVNALAGIARPERFFDMLRAHGLRVDQAQALPDHDRFNHWTRLGEPGTPLLCTEKDALKLWPHAPDALAVPLDMVLEPAFFCALDAALDQLPSAARTDSHGQETA